jgi:DNA polymerase-3 subunit gamma/tau
MARVLAKALNCFAFEAATTEPCCKCESCVAINTGDDIDVVEIDGASNTGVDNIRELRQNAIYRPARARYKIYIIDEVHMLSTGAFNALLKILEEPPGHVKFIFATTQPNKVIPTIRSRCQRFDFSNISAKEIALHLASVLKREKIEYEDDLVLQLAKMAKGSMRDALSLLDRLISTGVRPLSVEMLEEFLGRPNSEKIFSLVSEIGNSNAAGTLEAAAGLIDAGLGEVQIVDSLVDYMRDLMVVKSAGAETELLLLSAQEREKVSEAAEKFDIAGLVYNITTLEKLRWTIKNSETARTLLEASLLRFALSEHFLNIDSLLAPPPGGGAASKKKLLAVNHSTDRAEGEAGKEQFPFHLNDIDSVRNNWQRLLELVTKKLGRGTAGLLSRALPTGFAGSVLTFTFSSSAGVSKKMCESNGRSEQIEALLREAFRTDVKLKLELAVDEGQPVDSSQAVTGSQKRNRIMQEPAVKTILRELGATVTGIEEKN